MQHNISSTKITTSFDGSAQCIDLPLGLYFVKQTNFVDGFTPCKSFLVTLPQNNNGNYVYDVNASPKTEIAKLSTITIKKEWNTNKATAVTESVTVQLLNDGKVVKTAKLSKENNWQITYKNMPQSDAYTIKEINVPKGFTATYKQKNSVFTVTNTSTLIQTGQLMWPIPVFAISGMLLILIGLWLLCKKKRKTNA